MRGILTGLALPFRENKLNKNELIEHINSLVKADVDGFFVLGSIGLGPILSKEEKKEVLDILKETIPGNKYLVVQVGGTDWDTIVFTVKEAEKHEASAIATVPPIYYRADYETLKRYLLKLSKLTSLPLYIYNFPKNVGLDITPDILGKLLQDEIKIVGIKDTTPDMIEIIGHINLGIEVFNGIDSMTLPTLVMGGKGCISGLSNAIPELVVSIYKNVVYGNFEEAKKSQIIVSRMYNIVSKYPYPAIHYSLIRLLRYDFGNVKEPLVRNLTEEEEKALKNELKSIGFKIRE